MVEENTKATWLKDGAVLKADNRTQMISEKRTQKLIIQKVTSSDRGEYTCKVRNVSTTAKLSPLNAKWLKKIQRPLGLRMALY